MSAAQEVAAADYYVLYGKDDKEGGLHIILTDEGVVFDLFDAEGNLINSTYLFAQEIADDFTTAGAA